MKSSILRILGIAVISLLLSATYSCKSKKKVAETTDAEKERMEQMEKERIAREEEEERRRLEEEERRRREEEEAKARAPYEKLAQYFRSIANSGSAGAADRTIDEALNMFASDDVPVLIIIYENENENVTDYDEPTTIEKYLQYLKTVNRTPEKVKEIKFNDTGKISELILKKED